MMAIGISGSNDGVLSGSSLDINKVGKDLDVSYFVNNSCNLNCKHCYVGYNRSCGDLSAEEWKKVFEDLVKIGATTFGCVGKEPLLTWDKTKEILEFLKMKKGVNSRIRFGMVSNLTLATRDIVEDLVKIMPDYLDVSLDGIFEKHDYIRGEGSFGKTFENLKLIGQVSPELLGKVFVSFVLMKHNKSNFRDMILKLSEIGIKNILVSPYITAESEKKKFAKDLMVEEEDVIDFYREIVSAEFFEGLDDVEIILKNDYDTLKDLMDKCASEKLIDVDNLLIDEYDVIFNKYSFGSNNVIINYIPKSNLFSKEIRISHDGFVGNCYAQFFEDYPEHEKVIGNVKNESVEKLLRPYLD